VLLSLAEMPALLRDVAAIRRALSAR
jgi:hypothetical protein